ncbi:MAG: L,D-transpeptidase [Eubacteriales bacterium]|nr:L,D-transpeptidase [Eubacteriales bacterium]MDD3880700.1 L,D-transpeptidase [Eubacteriales bacterium]MDD4511666.1 L,D-transpeptidase [Eubacteriales bacterium]
MIRIEKANRKLIYISGSERREMTCALGCFPEGAKQREGDGKTPEGDYFICMKKLGKYGCSLAVSYPSSLDAAYGFLRGDIDIEAYRAIVRFLRMGHRPPWGTKLGGEIYIHGGGAESDWTKGCIALSDEDAGWLYERAFEGERVTILP